MLSENDIESIAVKHEDFGFGQVDRFGYTTHGFLPEGLRAFVAEVRKDDESLIRQMLEALTAPVDGEALHALHMSAIAAARARLEKAP